MSPDPFEIVVVEGDESIRVVGDVGLVAGRAVAHHPSCSRPLAGSWHMQDEGVIDCPQILRIGRDDMQIALACADRNRHIDDIGMA